MLSHFFLCLYTCQKSVSLYYVLKGTFVFFSLLWFHPFFPDATVPHWAFKTHGGTLSLLLLFPLVVATQHCFHSVALWFSMSHLQMKNIFKKKKDKSDFTQELCSEMKTEVTSFGNIPVLSMSCNRLKFLRIFFFPSRSERQPYCVPTWPQSGPDGGWTLNGFVQSQIITRRYIFETSLSPVISLVKTIMYRWHADECDKNLFFGFQRGGGRGGGGGGKGGTEYFCHSLNSFVRDTLRSHTNAHPDTHTHTEQTRLKLIWWGSFRSSLWFSVCFTAG